MGELRYAPQALLDIALIWKYIAKDDPDAADRMVLAIHEQARRLSDAPEAARKREDLLAGLKSFPVKRYMTISDGHRQV